MVLYWCGLGISSLCEILAIAAIVILAISKQASFEIWAAVLALVDTVVWLLDVQQSIFWLGFK